MTLHTKSNRLLRDLDLLQDIHGKAKCVVQMTLTTLDEQLCKKVEPGVCTTKERVQALQRVTEGWYSYGGVAQPDSAIFK